jgi:small-conductance mechanosensitive channel
VARLKDQDPEHQHVIVGRAAALRAVRTRHRLLELGLATKIRTPRREEVTIPNAVVVSNATTNFSRLAETEGVFVGTSVTIGYDVPWRQVKALLLLAAARTTGLRREPAPVVRQTELQDFCVLYTLLVCLEQPHLRGPVLDALHAQVQDAFNEYDVQIMSPHYEADPTGPKTVARDRWFAAPAAPDTPAEPSAAGMSLTSN